MKFWDAGGREAALKGKVRWADARHSGCVIGSAVSRLSSCEETHIQRTWAGNADVKSFAPGDGICYSPSEGCVSKLFRGQSEKPYSLQDGVSLAVSLVSLVAVALYSLLGGLHSSVKCIINKICYC